MRLDKPLVAFGVSLDRRLSSQPHNRPVTMWTEEMQDLDGAVADRSEPVWSRGIELDRLAGFQDVLGVGEK